MNYNQDIESRTHTQRLESRLGMVLILDRQGMEVFECQHGIGEIYVMFSQILGRLPWLPLVLQPCLVCTICAHSQGAGEETTREA